MGSPYEFQEQTNTQVADQGNGQNPFHNQIYGSPANGAPYFEQSNPNGQWRATFENTVPLGATTPIPGEQTANTQLTPANPDAGIPSNLPPTQVADNRENRTGQTGDLTPGTRGDLSGGSNGGGTDWMWMGDRAAQFGTSMYVAHRGIEGAEKFMPTAYNSLRGLGSEALAGYRTESWKGAGNALRSNFGGTATTVGTAGREFAQATYKTDLGKVLAGSFVANTAVDMLFFGDKTTSWKTWAVDIATPLAATALLGKFASPLKVIGITVGAHSLEKMLLEGKK